MVAGREFLEMKEKYFSDAMAKFKTVGIQLAQMDAYDVLEEFNDGLKELLEFKRINKIMYDHLFEAISNKK